MKLIFMFFAVFLLLSPIIIQEGKGNPNPGLRNRRQGYSDYNYDYVDNGQEYSDNSDSNVNSRQGYSENDDDYEEHVPCPGICVQEVNRRKYLYSAGMS